MSDDTERAEALYVAATAITRLRVAASTLREIVPRSEDAALWGRLWRALESLTERAERRVEREMNPEDP
jgi:hypothetical protein